MHKLLLVLLTLVLVIGITGCDNKLNDTTYILTIEVGGGNGTVTPEEGTHEIDENTTVNLKAIPAENYKFSHWDGNITEVNSAETTIMIDEDRTVTAYFVEQDESEIEGMVLVEAGTTSSDNGSLTIDNSFYIGKYHVTQAEFEDVMSFNPSEFNNNNHPNLTGKNDNRPVEQVSWYDAVMYCNELSEAEGLNKYYNISNIEYSGDRITDAIITENEEANGYRLTTAVEHEYAARGGKDGNATIYAGSDDLDEVGWYRENSDEANSEYSSNRGTMPVGEKEGNELGLYDMSGNVDDWVNTHPNKKGGHYDYRADICKVDSEPTPGFTNRTIGFRLARNP